MAGDAKGLGHQAGEVNTLETDCLKGFYTGYIVFLFCYKYMQMQNAETTYFVFLILKFDKYDL